MRSLFSLLGLLVLQTTFYLTARTVASPAVPNNGFAEFALKEGPDVFSPRTLIELGRPGTGVANPAGDLVLVPHTKFSLEEKTNNKSIFIASLEENTKPLEIALPNGGETFWLDRRNVGHAVDSGKGVLDLYALNINLELNLTTPLSAAEPVFIGTFPTKTATKFQYSNGTLVFVDYVYADGNLTAAKEKDDRRVPNAPMVFDELNERFWDSWLSPKSASLFSVDLLPGSNGKWRMGAEFKNLLQGTRHTSDDFSFVGETVVYTTPDPELSPQHGRRNVYLVKTTDPGKPVQLTTGRQGSTASPTLDSGAAKAAWIQQDEDVPNAVNKIVVFDLLSKDQRTLASKWDRSPESLAFSHSGDVMYLTAEDHARVKVYALPIPPATLTSYPISPSSFHDPVPLTHKGAAEGLQPPPRRTPIIFHADIYASQAPLESKPKPTIAQITRFSADVLESKNLFEGEEFWFKGALDKDVQGWIFKPKGWDDKDKKKWPVVMNLGPHSSNADRWSERWNPQVFSQQGYFSIWMNPTGSTGFGAEFSDAIVEDWGGKPFVDMVNGFKLTQIGLSLRGASWGGYAINWIQGHPEYGFNFKALVAHDAVFDSRYSSYTTDVPRFFNHEFGGVPWSRESLNVHSKFNPAEFIHRWSTPALMIHGRKDFRLAETEGIGAFHALQQLGIPSRLVIFPDENHWLVTPFERMPVADGLFDRVLGHEHSLKWHYEVFKWFDEFVGERASASRPSRNLSK
ncbi:Dipeptidyl-peptidase 5 [Mycena sanguinolenta]|uniref:Dipeptidyl-peptidase V n=1 Tax=Mycena sanguinolenta TaxID=230812 RepID=A0A8H7CT43_9AGAR|nr:Dipeptidyl-peptidase 5 [Mycena sanguinolenta]